MGFQSVRCPECGRDHQVEDRWIPELGAKVRCESCDRLLWIPPPSSENGEMDLLYDIAEPGAPQVAPSPREVSALSLETSAPPSEETPAREEAPARAASTPPKEGSTPARVADAPPSEAGAPASAASTPPQDAKLPSPDASAPPQQEAPEGPPGPDPLNILDYKLRKWIAGRDDQIRKALGTGSFFTKFGHEFLEMVEGDPDLTQIEAQIEAKAESERSPDSDGGSPTPGWLALNRLRKLLGSQKSAPGESSRS